MLDNRKNLLKINLTRPRLASAWAIGKLDMADLTGMASNKISHVFAHPVHVVNVVLHEQIGMFELLDDVKHLLTAVDHEPWHVEDFETIDCISPVPKSR